MLSLWSSSFLTEMQGAVLGVADTSSPSSQTFILCKGPLGRSLPPLSSEGVIRGEKEADKLSEFRVSPAFSSETSCHLSRLFSADPHFSEALGLYTSAFMQSLFFPFFSLYLPQVTTSINYLKFGIFFLASILFLLPSLVATPPWSLWAMASPWAGTRITYHPPGLLQGAGEELQ